MNFILYFVSFYCFSENQMFQFFVRASDRGSPPLHADVPVDVYIMGPSDTPPIFQQRDQKFFISENALPGLLFINLLSYICNFHVISLCVIIIV